MEQLAQRYHIARRLDDELRADLTEFYSKLIAAIDCRLIETERLLVLPSTEYISEDDEFGHIMHRRRRPKGSRLAIKQKAEKLKTILTDTLSSHANLSQSLDRSFPLRVFDSQCSATMSQDELRQELKKLTKQRKPLITASILH